MAHDVALEESSQARALRESAEDALEAAVAEAHALVGGEYGGALVRGAEAVVLDVAVEGGRGLGIQSHRAAAAVLRRLRTDAQERLREVDVAKLEAAEFVEAKPEEGECEDRAVARAVPALLGGRQHGLELLLGELVPREVVERGEFFGELALFEEATRDATAITVVATQVFQLSRASLARVLERNPRARDFAFRELAARIKALSAKYEDRVFLDVPGRLAKYLLELRRVRSELPITQDDLAAAIGSTRVTVNKLLADFERRGLVRIERRRVQVIDDAGLLAETRR